MIYSIQELFSKKEINCSFNSIWLIIFTILKNNIQTDGNNE